ncbi:MAG: hypothetical protein Ta2F_17200 [Termitinemataceae bacterium]|nr:MAG: hypothetical protein Ta2F_17200 [Termitinemataceae bacterium]
MMKDNGRENNTPKKNKKNKKNKHGNHGGNNGHVSNISKQQVSKQQDRKFVSTFFERHHDPSYVRPKWSPAPLLDTPLPASICTCCKKPIGDPSLALSDKITGGSTHFDCVVEKIKAMEHIKSSELVVYLGGGRFGIIRLTVPNSMRSFKILKIIEWENKDERAAWRSVIADHYSLT